MRTTRIIAWGGFAVCVVTALAQPIGDYGTSIGFLAVAVAWAGLIGFLGAFIGEVRRGLRHRG